MVPPSSFSYPASSAGSHGKPPQQRLGTTSHPGSRSTRACGGTITVETLCQDSCNLQVSTMKKARSSGTINVQRLAEFIYGGPERLATILRIAKMVEGNPGFSRAKRYHYSRKECLLSGLHISKTIVDFHRKHKLTWTESITLHFEMFIPVLKAQASEQQYEKWGKAAENFQIIGCYAQTEIGHGSNLSNLETSATFTKSPSGEAFFILNSPSLSSLKWWIGGLGVICTHALVQARLIINGTDYGPHLFIVQIRSLSDHSPMPGVEVGDIGAKFGMTKNDNGWVRFINYKLPRSHLLNRFADIDEEGNYVPPVHPKIFYGGMVIIRVELVEQSWLYLSRAVTITTRYTSIRRQFALEGDKNTENPVITYPLVQYRLFPLIATCFVFNRVGARINILFNQMMDQLSQFNADLLPFVHALSSGLKSYCTTTVADAIEECRKICGGHGFSKYSGFFHMYTEYVASNTYEGDNALLTQQTSRFLLKCHSNDEGKENAPLSWLSRNHHCLKASLKEARASFSDIKKDCFIAAFKHRVNRLVHELAAATQAFGFDSQNVLAFRVSVAFSQFFCLESILLACKDRFSPPVLQLIAQIYALYILDLHASDWLEDLSIDGTQLNKYRRSLQSEAFTSLHPEVIRLTDAFMIPDFLLDSVIGLYDGDAYRRLLRAALDDPVNVEVNSNDAAYVKYIRPILQGGTPPQSSKL